jgi:hypothetical protein
VCFRSTRYYLYQETSICQPSIPSIFFFLFFRTKNLLEVVYPIAKVLSCLASAFFDISTKSRRTYF